MRYLIVERFTSGARPVYERAEGAGQLMPDGLVYLDSWVDYDLGRSFNLVRTQNPDLIDEWIGHWSDLCEFEVIRVMHSGKAAAMALA